MTEKRFRVQEHCLRSSYGIEAENWLVTNDNHSVVLNDKAEAHMVANMGNDVIDKLNALHEENEQLKKHILEVEEDNERLEQITSQFKVGDIVNLKFANEIIDEQRKKIRILNEENEQLKQYKQAVSDVLLSYSQKNLSAKQLGLLTAIMHELGVLE